MLLAKRISKRLEYLQDELSALKVVGYRELRNIINDAVKPFDATANLIKTDMPHNDIGIGGSFEPHKTRCPITIEIFVSKFRNKITLSNFLIRETMFAIFQSLSHESIHKSQYRNRDNNPAIWFLTLDDEQPMTEKQTYLAEIDEIDAYGHDIAIELVHRYPKSYMDQLRNTHMMTPISWQMYLEAFEGTEWSDIKNRLLKKTYLHITRIRDYGEHYSCSNKLSR
jgi:hypothetical protein